MEQHGGNNRLSNIMTVFYAGHACTWVDCGTCMYKRGE